MHGKSLGVADLNPSSVVGTYLDLGAVNLGVFGAGASIITRVYGQVIAPVHQVVVSEQSY